MTTSRPARRRGPVICGCLLVGLVVFLIVGARHHRSTVTPSPSVTAGTGHYPAVTSTPDSVPSPEGQTRPMSGRAALQGSALAIAWLRGYLERPAGINDTTWIARISPLSDPVLVQNLTDAAPRNPVGLTWSAWHISAITPTTLSNQPAAAPTRQVTNWTITLTGPGRATSQRLYTLTAYPTSTGWKVGLAQQGYFSRA